ncbi:ribonuclease III domain-containing protein [Aspergillus carlsbadensis]|nr:ribonuclease III domain-containing protein [Aspergillus carlsbadensis]
MPPLPIPIHQRPQAFLTRFNLIFETENLIVEALRQAGYFGSAGNKDLAVIGDTTLRLYIQIEGRARRRSRGDINDMVQKLACNANLAARGFDLGIDGYIQNNPSQRGIISDGMMATTMEAIIGAVFLDKNRELAAVEPIIAAFGLTWPE